MTKKPIILAYLNGMPDVESVYPILARLHERGHIQVKALVYSKLMKKEPRLYDAFEAFGFMPELSSKLRMKLFYKKDIREANTVLTIADPLWDTTTRKQRGKYMISINKPPIYVQHGVYQRGINARWIKEPMHYHSSRLLLWEPLAENRKLFDNETQSKVLTVGFTKKDILPRPAINETTQEWLNKFKIKILVCQSFRWGFGRHDANSIDHFYDILNQFLSRNKHIGIIVRSHRGKIRRNHRMHDKAMRANHDNVLFSYQRSGPLAKYSIQDVVDLCDGMISPVSTTVLDALYMDKPVAIFEEGISFFNTLPRVDSLESLESFIKSIGDNNPVYTEVTQHFGNIDDNLTKACAAIERDMGIY